MLLSACMIVKDEEKYLPDCLDSIKNHIDELVIVDTGSTDRTMDIITEFEAANPGVRVCVGEWEWTGDFSAARNYGIKNATGDWLLIIDADERVPQEDMAALRNLLQITIPEAPVNLDEHDSIAVDILNAYKRDGVEGYNFAPQTAQMRIFRNGVGFRYDMKVHNQPCITNKPAFKIPFRIVHFGYERDAFKGKKAERYETMCRKQAEETPDIPIVHYNLGQALRSDGEKFQSQHTNEICEHLFKAIELSLGGAAGATPTGNSEQNQLYYDQIFAGEYDTSRYSKVYQRVLEMVLTEPYVLEIGCGTGDFGALLARHQLAVTGGGEDAVGIKDGKRVTNDKRLYRGVDFSQEAIAQARKQIDKTHGNLILGDIYDPVTYQGNWDCVVALEVLEHVDDLRVINLIPVGKRVIFSVPDYTDTAHLRVYLDEAGIRDRFKLLLDIKTVTQCDMGGGGIIWLVEAERKENPYESILVQSYNLLGWVHYWSENYQEAIKCAISALRLKPDYLDSVLLLGYAFGDAGEFNSSEAWFWRYLDFQRKYDFATKFDGITTAHPDERVAVYKTLANIEMVRRQVTSDEIALSLKGENDEATVPEEAPGVAEGESVQPG